MRNRIILIIMCLVLCLTMGAIGAAMAEQTEMTDTVEEEIYAQFRVDPEEAEKQYLNGLFGLPVARVQDVALYNLRATVAGDLLDSEMEKNLYDALRKRVGQVVAGTLTSTQFVFSDDVFDPMTFTAEDLGLAAGTVLFSDNSLTSAANEKINAILGPKMINVIQAVLYDCPYETFWRDLGYAWGKSWSGTTVNGKQQITIVRVTAIIYVSKEYSATGATGTTDVNATRISSAVNAVNNAQSIINDNAHLGNYAKLVAYKDAICGLTEYNDPAAEGNWDYGNPWQLVWVFDGDPSTTVVCEGYSKAFYYLCDNSKWAGDAVQVICVSGQMWSEEDEGSGFSGGAHMWNIVRMNEQNYLADVTNTDSGNPGLFLDGYDEMLGDDIYLYESATYESGAVRYLGYSFDNNSIKLFGDEGLLNLATEAAPEPPAPTITVDKSSVMTGEDITISACLPGAGHIRVGTEEGIYINDYFTEIQEGDTATWTMFFDYPGEYNLFISGWSDGRWNDPAVPDVIHYPDMGGVSVPGTVTVTVTAQEEQGTLPEATITIPEPLDRYRTIDVEIPEFPAAINYSVICRRTDNREIAWSRTEDAPFDTSISCAQLEENVLYDLEVKVRRNGYASYTDHEYFTIWAPIMPEAITPGEDMTITLPPKEGAVLYELCVETSGIVYYVKSDECGDFVIPAMVFADGGGYTINIYVYRASESPEEDDDLWARNLYWGTFNYDAEAYTGAQTLTISAGTYHDSLQTINLSVADADQVIIQEKEIVYWGYEGYECWSTVNVTDNPGAAVDVSLLAKKEHEIRAAVKKDGEWSAWSPVIEVTTPAHGKCNENIEWTLSDSGKMTISGTGEIPYEMYDSWDDFKDEITEVEIGSGITGIGSSVFYQTSNLTTVTIPATLVSIGQNAFDNCGNLTTITAANAVLTEYVRCYEGVIKAFSLPSTVTEIGYCAFVNTPEFGVNESVGASFSIPLNTGRIEENAFYAINASSVRMQVYNLDNCVIEDYAFGNCTDLRYFLIDSWGENVNYTIADHAFDGCTNLTFIGEENEYLREYAEDHGFVYMENEAVWGNG